MQARMKNPAMILPDAMQALQALGKAAEQGGVPPRTLALVDLRASQINGCSVCVDMHARFLKKAGETDERLFAVAAWRDAPYFSEPERAAGLKPNNWAVSSNDHRGIVACINVPQRAGRSVEDAIE